MRVKCDDGRQFIAFKLQTMVWALSVAKSENCSQGGLKR